MNQGQYNNLLNSLVEKFHGSPDGMAGEPDLAIDHLLPFQNSTRHFDLLTGKLDITADKTNPLLQILDRCHTWFIEHLKKTLPPGEVSKATLEFTVGKVSYVDLSEGQAFTSSEVKRDENGRAYVDKTFLTKPEWKSVPRIPFVIKVLIVAKGKTYSYDDTTGTLEFRP